jgi:hypothetical protein
MTSLNNDCQGNPANPANSVRARRLLTCASVLALSTAAHAVENNLPVVSAIPASVVEGQAFSLLFAGTSPDGCGIARDSVRVVGDVITVLYRRGGGANVVCTQALVPFRQPITVFGAGEGARAGTYKVRVELVETPANGTVSVTKLLSFALVPVLKSGQRPVLPESGQWRFEEGGPYATSGNGIGFSIDRQNDTVVNVSNFYGASGRPEWYFTSGTLASNTLNADFYTIAGGQSLFGAYRPPTSVDASGALQLEFTSPTRGTAWVSQPVDNGLLSGLKIMPISITRFNFGYGDTLKALAGRWVLASEGTSALESRTLSFASTSSGNTQSNYSDSDYRLSCTANLARPAILSDTCTLTRAGALIGTFDSVGYERLRGQDSAGKAISLFRLD